VFGGPTWAELGRRPPTEQQLESHRHGDRPGDEEALHALLRSIPTWGHGGLRGALRTRALRQLTAEATVLLHRREETRAALAVLGGQVRRLVLEQGRRLVRAGMLTEATDVELLTPVEVRAALDGRPPAPRAIADRRRWRVRYESAPPLPARFTGTPVPESAVMPVGDRYDAWAVSSGQVTARAVAAAAPDADVEPGSVLVAVSTDASWSPLFLDAAGIVVERGGPLSHAAILARELGVPAVVNLPGACRALDGRIVTVDGDTGIVVVHDDERSER
jgi:pyruvate,water dikinase